MLSTARGLNEPKLIPDTFTSEAARNAFCRPRVIAERLRLRQFVFGGRQRRFINCSKVETILYTFYPQESVGDYYRSVNRIKDAGMIRFDLMCANTVNDPAPRSDARRHIMLGTKSSLPIQDNSVAITSRRSEPNVEECFGCNIAACDSG